MIRARLKDKQRLSTHCLTHTLRHCVELESRLRQRAFVTLLYSCKSVWQNSSYRQFSCLQLLFVHVSEWLEWIVKQVCQSLPCCSHCEWEREIWWALCFDGSLKVSKEDGCVHTCACAHACRFLQLGWDQSFGVWFGTQLLILTLEWKGNINKGQQPKKKQFFASIFKLQIITLKIVLFFCEK